jgi:hypothetical protein
MSFPPQLRNAIESGLDVWWLINTGQLSQHFEGCIGRDNPLKANGHAQIVGLRQ